MPKLILIGWDGADWEMAHPMLAAGELPALQYLLGEGASGNLRTLQPPLSPMLWTSIATGKTADQHGVLGFTEVDNLSGKVRPVLAASRRCGAVWDILAEGGHRCHTVGWFASHGGTIPGGSVVSNLYPAPAAGPDQEWPPSAPGAIWPAANAPELDALRLSPQDIDGSILQLFCPEWQSVNVEEDHRLNHLQIHLAEIFTIQAAARWTLDHQDWDFLAIYFRSPDEIAHHFMQFHPPRMEGVPEREYALYKEVMRATYRLHDLMLGRLIDVAPLATTNFMVISDHGFQCGPHRPRYTPNVPAGITVWHREHGIFAAAGPDFQPGAEVQGAGLLDIAPTILEIFGLPAGQDMPGRVLKAALRASDRPSPKRIPSWEGRLPARSAATSDLTEAESQALIEQFIALGYMEKPSGNLKRDAAVVDRENRWTLARSLLASGRPADALPVLAGLYREMPERTDFAQTFAHCQLQCGLTDDAKETIDAVLETANNQPVIALLRAQIALAVKEPVAALGFLEEARRSPVGREPRFWLQYGRCMLALRRWQDALAAADELLRLVPDEAFGHLGRAIALLRLNQLPEAEAAARATLALDYAMPLAHTVLARALLKQNRKEEALGAILHAYDLTPNIPGIFSVLMLILWATGEQEDLRTAAAHWRTLRKSAQSGRQRLRKKMLDALKQPETAAALSDLPHPKADTIPEETILIVTGLPRSGTSLVMQMLQAGGYPIHCDDLRPADEHNPRGYLEWQAIRQLPAKPKLIDEAAGKAVKVVTPLLPHLPAGRNYRFIHLRRKMEEVARSQTRMRAVSAPAPPAKGVQTEALEKLDNLSLALLPKDPERVLSLDFAEMIAQPSAAAEQLAAFLGQDWVPSAAAMAACIDPSLYRQRA